MTLEQLASLSSTVSAVTLIVSVIYAAIQIRHNTRAVLASTYQQVVNSFAQISFEIASDKSLVELYVRASRSYDALDEVERARYGLMLLSFLRRAENVYFQTEIHMLDSQHWIGIRNSIQSIVSPPGAQLCWQQIRSRLNPTFATFVTSLIDGSKPDEPPPLRESP
jgi:hypothetical protein